MSESAGVVPPLHITFVCTGNICRSPMAANIVRDAVARAGWSDAVWIDSAGTGDWHAGQPADDRTRRELLRGGYPDEHVAAALGHEHADADLFVALDSGHMRDLTRRGYGDRSRLLREFDPEAVESARDDPGTLDVADPYYGDADDFATVRGQVEAAVPGLLEWIRDRLDGRDPRG